MRQRLGGRRLAVDRPHARLQELIGHLERLGLHVLGHRQRHRAGLGRVGQHAHRLERGGDQLLGPLEALIEARHRTEAVVDRHRGVVRQLEHLEHGMRRAGGERVAGQQQHREAVDRGQRRAGHHVGRPRPDRGRAGERAQAVALPGIARRDVDHPLLVARRVVGQRIPILMQRLPQPGDVAVPEDPVAAGEEPLTPAVALDLLRGQEADQRLSDREARHARDHDDSSSDFSRPNVSSRSGSSTPSCARGDGGVQARVAGDGPASGRAGRRRADVEQVAVEFEHLDRAPGQRDAVGVLAAAAVQDAGHLALERPPDQLGRRRWPASASRSG